MTRTMYDGLGSDAAAIARAFGSPDLVAGYVDGNFVWSQADWNLFPNSKHILVSAIPGSSEAMSADVADCETGDYDAPQAAGWAFSKRRAGYDRPTIYCNLDTAGAVRNATGSLILGVDYDLWIADWTGSPHSITFSDGRKAAVTQYENASFYDKSAVYRDSWPAKPGGSSTPPPDNDGPVWHSIPNGNTESLEAWCASRGTNVDHIVTVTMANASPAHGTLLTAYLLFDKACIAAGIHHATMPTGMVLYSES